MNVEAGSVLVPAGASFCSPGGHYRYEVLGPICRLYDREQLPWPCCSLQWHGKQPCWNRHGARYVADMAAARFPSYRVRGSDSSGNSWVEDRSIYGEQLAPALRQWWITRKPVAAFWPDLPQAATWAGQG